MGPRTRAASAILMLIPLSGCCTMSLGLSAAFCGPRKPLPRRNHLTAGKALETYAAAIATDDLDTIFETLGPDLKRRWKLGVVEAAVMWRILKEKVPGIHLLDQAKVSPPIVRKNGIVSFRLTLAGQVVEVDFKQYAYTEVVTLLEGDEDPEAISEHLKTSEELGELLSVKTEADTGTITVRIKGFDFTPMPREVLSAKFAREWLVYDLRVGAGN